MSAPESVHRATPAECEVGDHFLIADIPAQEIAGFEEVDSPHQWTAPNGEEWRFQLVELPVKGGSDFGWQRVA